MVVGRALRQRCKIGGFRDRQFRDRFVEIGECRTGDTVGIQTEKDLVEIKLEDLVLGIGLLDAEGQKRFLELAVEGLVVGEQEVLRHLLSDCGRADRTTAGADILEVDENGTAETPDVHTRMVVEILVFRRKESCLHTVRDSLDRQEQALFMGVFRHERAVAGVHAGRHRRLISAQNCVIRQVLRHAVQINCTGGGGAQEEHAGQAEKISNQSDHTKLPIIRIVTINAR